MKTVFKKFFNEHIKFLSAVILAGALVHSFMLGGTFKTMDDEVSIVENPHIKDSAHIKDIFKSSFFGEGTYYRPLVSLSFMAEYHFFGLNPFYYNFTNLCLHLLNAVMVWLILRSIALDKKAAFLSALLFAVHPVHWEAVSNIAGRSVLLCGFWYATALYCFTRAVRDKNAPWFTGMSLASFVLSLLSKESAVTFPLTLMSYEVFFRRKINGREQMKSSAVTLAPFFLLLAGYMFLRKVLGITRVALWPSLSDGVLGVMTFLRASLTHARVVFFPFDLHFDRARAYYTEFLDLSILVMAAVFICAGWFFLKFHKRWSATTKFFLFWPVLTSLPVSQMVPVRAHGAYASTAEHFLYIPSLGVFAVMILAGLSVGRKAATFKMLSGTASRWVTTGFFLFLMLTTIQMNLLSTNELGMFERTLRYDPRNTRARVSYALALAKRGRFPGAEEQFRRVLVEEPWDIRSRIGLGKALCDQGRYWEGIEEYEKVPRLSRVEGASEAARNLNDLVEKNLKLSYLFLIQHYKDLLALDPVNPQVHYTLGVVYAKMGKMEAAVDQFKRTVIRDPENKNALFNLASSLDPLGRKKQAVRYFKRMTALEGEDEMDGYAYIYLSEFYRQRGDEEKMKLYSAKALAIKEEARRQESGGRKRINGLD
ncbi:MAG TPA: hypothetical protein DD723_05495 [Candidatus Omnitrophica bacterium]|nr:MAG: hypothetical protein A2Z81_05555 [Omnitrophica WOR_2 bacterium GWA2_45_18]HBR14981.1 hypothetical protein [Candidatus Omnitrophota bacterium]